MASRRARAVDPLRGARRDAAGAEEKLDNLRLVSAASLVCCGGIALLVVSEMFASDRDAETSYVVADFRTLKNLPIFVFGFTCHQNIFAVNNELGDPTRGAWTWSSWARYRSPWPSIW